jgi:quinol monooxygenase YgiN
MSRVVEIRTYNLKPGTREEFRRLFLEQAGPMLARWGVDVVGFAQSLHDENSFYLMRCYASPEDRQRSQDSFYGSDEWLRGPREAILNCIESYASAVMSLDDETINGLRRAHSEKQGHAEG